MSRIFKYSGTVLWLFGLVSLIWAMVTADDTYQLGDLSVFVGAILLAAFTAFVAAYVFECK